MLVVREPKEQGDVEELGNDDNAAEEPVTVVLEDDVEDQSIPSPTLPTPPPQQPPDIPSTSQGRMIDELDKDEGVVLMNEKEET
nr:hypothetical protein [Tanacetum cinerariifolium]